MLARRVDALCCLRGPAWPPRAANLPTRARGLAARVCVPGTSVSKTHSNGGCEMGTVLTADDVEECAFHRLLVLGAPNLASTTLIVSPRAGRVTSD